MSDTVGFVVMTALFALAVTLHVAVAVSLGLRTRAWRGLVAFVVAPLAPIWAFQDGMRIRGVLWIVAVVGYLIARALLGR